MSSVMLHQWAQPLFHVHACAQPATHPAPYAHAKQHTHSFKTPHTHWHASPPHARHNQSSEQLMQIQLHQWQRPCVPCMSPQPCQLNQSLPFPESRAGHVTGDKICPMPFWGAITAKSHACSRELWCTGLGRSTCLDPAPHAAWQLATGLGGRY